MRPFLLKGHERPLTHVKFNRDSDLLFTMAKDKNPTVWRVSNGERLGTFVGHQGTVWQCDISFDSSRLLTGSADKTAKLWEATTGKCVHTWEFDSGVRSVGWAHGERMVLCAQDQTFNSTPSIFIYNIAGKGEEQSSEPVRTFKQESRVNRALWGGLNETIIHAGEDGTIRSQDVETGEIINSVTEHKKEIKDMQFSVDRTMLITASADFTAKLWDAKTLECIKTFSTDRPVNSSAISPIYNQIILGGGQEAMDVTTTSAKAGKFECDFYHSIYEQFLGSVKGHFGPINTLAFAPDGKSYASGAEDGYIRLHHMPSKYFQQSESFNSALV